MVNEDDRLKVVEHGSMQGGVINDLSSQLLDNTTGMFSQKFLGLLSKLRIRDFQIKS